VKKNKRFVMPLFLILIILFIHVIPIFAQDNISDESFIRLMAARNAWKAGDYEKAVRRYDALVKGRPELLEAAIEFGWLLIEMGRAEKALAIFENTIKTNPDHKEVAYNYIQALLSLRHFKQLGNVINDLLKRYPEDKRTLLFKAELFTQQMEYNNATSIYLNLIETEFGREARKGMADLNTAMGEYEKAGEILEKLVIDSPDDPEIRIRQVINLANRQRIIEAYRELKEIKEPFLREQAEAELLNIFGEYFRAEMRFRELLKKHPSNYALYIGLAESLVGQEDYDSAAGIYQSILSNYPEDLRAMVDLIDLLIIQRKYTEAQEFLERILKENPDNIRALYLSWWIQYLRSQKEDSSILHQLSEVIKTQPEARMIQRLMLKKGDYRGLILLSEKLMARGIYDQIFLANYFTALLNKGEINKGINTITNLLEKDPDNSFLKTSLSEFYMLDGDKAKAIELLNVPEKSLKQASVYYKLKSFQDSTDAYLNILMSDQNNIKGYIGVIKGLTAIGETDLALQLLNILIEKTPSEARTSVALLLSWVPDGSDLYYEIVDGLLQEWVKDAPENIDLQIAQSNIFIHQRRYTDAIAGYKALKERMPSNPYINLRLARLFSWNKEYDETLTTYDEYLRIKPYDLNAWREKARFYGWVIEPENALSEYENILKKYPNHTETELERKAKEAFWRGRNRLAGTYYLSLLEGEPNNSEALFDMGQISSNGLRPADAQDYYRRILEVMPRHRQTNLALELSEIYQRPQGILGYGYVERRGYGDKTLITYWPFTLEGNLTISESLTAGIGYQNVRFEFDEGSFTGDIARLGFRYIPNHYLYLDGFVSILKYHKINEDHLNFGAGLSYEWLPGIHMRIGLDRKDLWENRATLLSDIYIDRYYATLKTDLTKRIDLTLLGDYSLYSDDNRKINGEVFTSYKILSFPRMFRIIFKLNSYGFDKESVYFSPNSYTIWTVAVDWWHFLGFPFGKEYLSEGKTKNLYSLYYGFSVDSNNDIFHEWISKFSYSLTRRLSLNGRAQFIRSNVYKENNINAYLEYYF